MFGKGKSSQIQHFEARRYSEEEEEYYHKCSSCCILRHITSDVSQFAYVIGALLGKAKFGGGVAHNSDTDPVL